MSWGKDKPKPLLHCSTVTFRFLRESFTEKDNWLNDGRGGWGPPSREDIIIVFHWKSKVAQSGPLYHVERKRTHTHIQYLAIHSTGESTKNHQSKEALNSLWFGGEETRGVSYPATRRRMWALLGHDGGNMMSIFSPSRSFHSPCLFVDVLYMMMGCNIPSSLPCGPQYYSSSVL